MATTKTDYLIIGNSAAGVTAAESIRAFDRDSSVTILSREPYAAYGRPLISYLIEGKTDLARIGFKSDTFYDDLNLTTSFGPESEVVELKPDDHQVKLAGGDFVEYKKCLLATGSIPFTPPIKGLEGKKNVYTFITLDDAQIAWAAALRATEEAHKLDRKSKVIVIGAGLIGLKAAEALSHHVDEVLVLELAPRILPAVLDADGAAILQELLYERGITCMPGVSAEELLGEGDAITGALLTNGEKVECDFVIAAVGVRPNSSLAVAAGAAEGRGLVCDTRLETSLKDVYAAGDVTQVTDLLDGSEKPLALWPNAMHQGRIAGLNMVGAPGVPAFEGNFAVNAVDFFDISLLTAGLINPQPDSGCEERLIVDKEQGRYAKFVVRDGLLVGYILLNRPGNAGIYTALIENKIPLNTLKSDLFENEPENMDFVEAVRWERLHKGYPSNLDKRGWKEKVGCPNE